FRGWNSAEFKSKEFGNIQKEISSLLQTKIGKYREAIGA
ncbi:unnamed protein product, partial [marine sediment metagenome]